MAANTSNSQLASLVDEVETAVPALKVMRLQQPELQRPVAGTLDTRCLISSAMCLPDSFGVINVGETFTAYLGALNVSKHLHVVGLRVTAQLQTPTQRWQLASSLDVGNANGGVDIPPEEGVETIVSHSLEESGQHILRVEVGYSSGDGSTKTLRKFYRFQVLNPLSISELTIRTGDASCFVSISLQNTSDGLTISSADFEPSPGLSVEVVRGQGFSSESNTKRHPKGNNNNKNSHPTALELFDKSGRLENGSCVRYLYKVSASSKTPSTQGIAAGDVLGKAIISWYKAVGESGRMESSPIRCPESNPRIDQFHPGAPMIKNEPTDHPFLVYLHGSSLSVDAANVASNHEINAVNQGSSSSSSGALPMTLDRQFPVTVEPIDPPHTMILSVPQEIQFLVVNHSNETMSLQLQFQTPFMSDGLVVCGQSFKNMQDLPGSGGSTTVSLRFVAIALGVQRLQGCCIVDIKSTMEIPQPPLFNVLVEKGPSKQ